MIKLTFSKGRAFLIKKILILLLIFLLSISFLFFNDKGNQWLRPYFANYLESKVGRGMHVDVSHLKIDLNHIEFNILVNSSVEIEGEGKLSLLTQDLNLYYTIKSDSLENRMDVNGTVTGSFFDMYIDGEGEMLQSTIDYRLYRKDNVLHGVKLKIDNADVASFFKLTSQAVYARGKVDVKVDIENLEKQSVQTNVKIRFHETRLNANVFKEKLEINLLKNIILTANLDLKVCNKYFQLEGFVKNNLATLNLYRAHYDMETKELSSDYILLVPELSKLTNDSKQKLKGKLKIEGRFKSKNSKVCLAGKCKDFGGKIVFNLNENKLNAYMNGVDIEKLLYLLGEKPYMTGKLMADIELDDIEKKEGIFNFKTKDAKTVDDTFRKKLNLNFQKSVPFVLNVKGSINGQIIDMKAKLNSEIFDYSSSDIKYKLSSNKLSSSYFFQIPKLSKLNSTTGKNLKGELSIIGELNYDEEMIVTGNSQNFGGNIDFKLKAQKLNTELNNVSVEKFLNIFSYPEVFKAKLVGNFDYNLATHSGKITSKLNQVELLNSSLAKVIRKIRGSKIDKERYDKTYFNAIFHKNFVDIDFEVQSKTVLLSIPSGRINQEDNTIHAYYKMKVDNIEVEGKIRGALSHPEVTFNSAKYLQNNMMSVIEDTIPSPAVRGFKMGKKNHDTMKNMMFDFFK